MPDLTDADLRHVRAYKERFYDLLYRGLYAAAKADGAITAEVRASLEQALRIVLDTMVRASPHHAGTSVHLRLEVRAGALFVTTTLTGPLIGAWGRWRWNWTGGVGGSGTCVPVDPPIYFPPSLTSLEETLKVSGFALHPDPDPARSEDVVLWDDWLFPPKEKAQA